MCHATFPSGAKPARWWYRQSRSDMEQSSPQPRTHAAICNPVHAGLQLLTDVLLRIPGPHQRRIGARQTAGDASLAQASTAGSQTASSSPVQRLPASGQTTEQANERISSLPAVHGRLDPLHAGGPVTRQELGQATWTLLHTLAAQFPEQPSRQQRKDAKQLVGRHRLASCMYMLWYPSDCYAWCCLQVDALTRIYPCAECAHHFADIVRCARTLKPE